MTRTPLTLTALLLSTSAAFAGPVDVPPVLPPVVIVPDEPFEGAYIGLEYGHGSGSVDASVTGGPVISYDLDGEAYGAFAGYNVQNGSLIYGGELRYLHLNLEDPTAVFQVDSVLDLRARVGFAASDQLLIYGAAGYSIAQATVVTGFDMTGFNYGAGVEYNVTERWFLGADVTARDLEGTLGAVTYDGMVNTATLRVGFRF